jgi:multidrug resistance efflux pump
VKASGFTEAEEVLLSSQVAALITDMPAVVGRPVSSGSIVARLDDAGVQLQLRLADPLSRQSLELEANKYVIRSPLDGVVTRVPAHAGEEAVPGRVLVAVADTAQLQVTLSVPLRDLASVHVGQPVAVVVDSLPDRAFAGRVTSIADKAAFTPRNVQTQADRLNLVYEVRARVDNREGVLKSGMPVEATFLVAS